MGCTPTKKQFPLQRRQTKIGILKTTIQGIHTHTQAIEPQSKLKLRVSNQTQSTNNLPPLTQQHKTPDTLTFFINSFHKPLGRTIDIGYFIGDDLQAHGIIDANPFIESNINNQMRCILTDNKYTQFGFVQLRIIFEQLPAHDITFRFQSATIRRKNGGCCNNSQQFAVRLTIAQQQLYTEYQTDTPNKPPVWQDRKYNFKVPNGVGWGHLQLIDQQDQIIGSADINLNQIYKMKQGDEVLQTQQLFFQQNQQRVIAADIKYTFMLGEMPNFKPRTELFTSAIRAIRSQNITDNTQK